MFLSVWDKIKIGVILIGAIAVMWALMIYPHSGEWEAAGETQGTVKTLMSNSKVLGAPQINAVVTFDNGRETVIAIPLRSDVRAGDRMTLAVDADAKKPSRKRYRYLSETN